MKSLCLLLFATVAAIAAPPTPKDDVAIVSPGKQVEIKVVANDSDPDPGDTLTLQPGPTGALHGTLSVNGNSVFYQAGATLEDTDQFTYTVSDGTTTTSATVTVATLTAIKGTYTGLATVAADPGIEPGKLNVQLNSLGRSTLSATWQGVTYRDKHPTFGSNGLAVLILKKPGGTGRIELSLQLQPAHNSTSAGHQLIGTLTDRSAAEQILAIATFALGHTPKIDDEAAERPTSGRYTSFLQGDMASDFAELGGFTIFNISKNSRARIIGQMPDSEPFTAGSPYAGRRYVINQRLYKDIQRANPGSQNYVAGEPTYTRPSMIARSASLNDMIEDRLSWQRGARQSALYYPGGITAFRNLLLIARGYPSVARSSPPPINFTQNGADNGEVTITGGDLAATLSKLVRVQNGPKVKAPDDDVKLTVRLIGGTPLFRGSFAHPLAGKVKFRGSFDKAEGEGRGAFKGITTRGLIIIRPKS